MQRCHMRLPTFQRYQAPRCVGYKANASFSQSLCCFWSGKLTFSLADDAVLTALGSPDEFTGEQREKFCNGLRQVLMGLRVRKIRDFDIIASEIVAHRSKFLGDKSKILAVLEGTHI
jgi:hypothetical protein